MRRASRGSHQFTWRNGPRRMGGGSNVSGGGGDRKPLVLSTYLDAQEHLPYADDSAAVTPMSEDNGAIIMPLYYPTNLGQFSFFLLFILSRFLLAKTCSTLSCRKQKYGDDVRRQKKNKNKNKTTTVHRSRDAAQCTATRLLNSSSLRCYTYSLNNKRLS